MDRRRMHAIFRAGPAPSRRFLLRTFTLDDSSRPMIEREMTSPSLGHLRGLVPQEANRVADFVWHDQELVEVYQEDLP